MKHSRAEQPEWASLVTWLLPLFPSTNTAQMAEHWHGQCQLWADGEILRRLLGRSACQSRHANHRCDAHECVRMKEEHMFRRRPQLCTCQEPARQ